MVGPKIPLKKRKPYWLGDLLRSNFSGSSCADHSHLNEKENTVNRFCIQCRRCICKHCTFSSANHHLHAWIKIFRYSSNDVVRLEDIQQHLDCSQIQSYIHNGVETIHLNARPLPSKTKLGTSCEVCGRKMQDPYSCFCSIACKFSAVSVNSEDERNMVNLLPIPEVPDLSLNDESNPEGNRNNSESAMVLAQSPEVTQASVNISLEANEAIGQEEKPFQAELLSSNS